VIDDRQRKQKQNVRNRLNILYVNIYIKEYEVQLDQTYPETVR
jgi:hypothetical protein